MRRVSAVGLLCLSGALALAWTTSTTTSTRAAAMPPVFDAGRILPGQGGGEPSLAIDLSNTGSRNDVYVEAIGGWGKKPPAGDPKGSGPVLWHSYDRGATFAAPVAFDSGAQDSMTSGGDGDVTVDDQGNVIVTDLNVTYTWVQVSSDHGQTFNTGTPTAPENDRPWLTADGSIVYVVYHDFVAEIPVVCTSTDGGNTFTTCNPLTITNPTAGANCAENTVPARPLSVDPTDKSLNFMFSCSTTAENLQHPPYGPLHDYWLAQSTDGGVTWSDYPVLQADLSNGKAPNFANIFSTLAIDSAGNYYALVAGTPDDTDPVANPYHVYLLTSTDHGHTWSGLKQVDHDPNGAGTHTEAHFVATTPGNVDIAWYGTDATGEPNGVCGTVATQAPCNHGLPNYKDANPPAWNVYLAQATDALSATPTFTQARVSHAPVHWGEICTNGLVCGKSDRSLLDFLSLGVDCNGLAHVAFAGNTIAEETADFGSGAANIHEANQVGGSTIAPPAACGAPNVVAVSTSGGSATATPTPAAGVQGATAVNSLPNTAPAASGAAGWAVVFVPGVVIALAAGEGRRRRRRPPARR